MAISRTARLVARGLVLGTCGVLAACGFTGLGAGPAASDLEAGTGAGHGGNTTGDGAADDGNPAFGEGGVINVGGSGGDGDAAVDADGAVPDGSTIICPSGCTSCTGTTCNILCDLTHPCSKPITCPPGLPCHVTCDAVVRASPARVSR